MAKNMKKRKVEEGEEEDDEDFVKEEEDEEEEDEEEEEEEKKPPKKMLKPAKKKAKAKLEGPQKDGKISLGGKKFVTVDKFKGMVLVNIREHYEDKSTGQMKPGKKGIALQVAQWETLKEHVEDISMLVEAFRD